MMSSKMSLVDASFSSIKGSLIAAGALWLADYIKGTVSMDTQLMTQ